MGQLEVENLTKIFNNGNNCPHAVLQNLFFAVNEGEFLSIVGPSGCGKTTLLSIIAGFLHASGGRVIAGDRIVTAPGPDRAFVFQNYALFPWMTVRDNILYPMKRQGMPRQTREARLSGLLELANLAGRENLFPHQLSGGMKQRTAVIRALACHPRFLLMDEPLGALDVQMRRKLQVDLEGIFLRDPATVLMVTHDMDEAAFLSDRVIVISGDGRIVADLPVSLPRPRDRRSKQYYQVVVNLMDILQDVQGEGGSNQSSELPETGMSGQLLQSNCTVFKI